MGPETEAVLAEFRRHQVITRAAQTAHVGEAKAMLQAAEIISGRAQAAGKPLPWVIAALGDAAADLAAEGPGLQWPAVARKLRTYADRASRPHVEAPDASERRSAPEAPKSVIIKPPPFPGLEPTTQGAPALLAGARFKPRPERAAPGASS